MPALNTIATLDGFLKKVYADKVKDLLPVSAILQRLIPFEAAQQIGDSFLTPVDLQFEHGITYAASGTSPNTLLASSAGQMKNATVNGSQFFGVGRIDYELMYKAMNDSTDLKAFGNATKWIVKRLINSVSKRLEIDLLWGQQGIATIASLSGAGTTRNWVITTAEWSSGIWAGMVGASLDVYDPTFVTKRNTNAQVIVTAVNHDTKTVSVSGNATDLTAIIALDAIFFETSSATNSMVGLNKILGNSATTLFGIDPALYPLWGGNVTTGSGTPTQAKLVNAAAKCIAFGLEDDVVALVSPEGYATLNAELSGYRQFDRSYSPAKGENGVESINYHGQSGTIKVVAHPYQKLGYMHILPYKECKRIGATDLVFRKHGKGGDELILEVASQGSAEMRLYGNQAIICLAPKRGGQITGVTP